MSSPYLVKRLNDMAGEVRPPRVGEWDVPSLMREAATEIAALQKYAFDLEEDKNPLTVKRLRDETQVDGEAIDNIYK